jgi:hypothetical protein
MTRQAKRVATLREVLDEDRALLDAADAIADMAYRVRLNGAERVYASEKLGHALYKAAEGLALCDVELDEIAEEARRGHQHGLWIKEDAR